MSYEASMLNMELKANSAEVLQTLTNQLKQQGFKVELGKYSTKCQRRNWIGENTIMTKMENLQQRIDGQIERITDYLDQLSTS